MEIILYKSPVKKIISNDYSNKNANDISMPELKLDHENDIRFKKSEDIKRILYKIEKRKRGKKLKFSFVDSFKLIFRKCCVNKFNLNLVKKMNVFDKGKIQIKDYFDIIKIIQKFEEYDRLAKVMLTDIQYKLFSINSKPKIRDIQLRRTSHYLENLPNG